VLGSYRRRMRDRGIVDGRSGAVSVVQRTSADLRLNPYIHSVVLDGVFAPSVDGTPVFHPPPALDNRDVGDLLQVVRLRIVRMLVRADRSTPIVLPTRPLRAPCVSHASIETEPNRNRSDETESHRPLLVPVRARKQGEQEQTTARRAQAESQAARLSRPHRRK
jgi:hypothetical protein